MPQQKNSDPTFLGSVTAVTGASVTVMLAESIASGLAIIGGHTYQIGQVGSFVRIPKGYQDLYGIVTEVGANAAPNRDANLSVDASRWMRVELAGEAIGTVFERGISQHPNIRDPVHIVVEKDLIRIYGSSGEGQVPIGVLSSAENIQVRISLDLLVTRHAPILGSTGSGKSTTVASLLRSIVVPELGRPSPGARILLLDVHGEYSAALSDIANVYSATPQARERQLFVPYWALEVRDFLEFLTGGLSEPHEIAFTDKITELKRQRVGAGALPGATADSITVDSPIPFSLHKLWYDLIDFELMTFSGKDRDVRELVHLGDAVKLTPPQYKPHGMGSAGPFLNNAQKGIKRPLELLRSRMLDRRFDFLLHPGDWEPNLNGEAHSDLDVLLQGWLGGDKPITILDLSGVPSSVLSRMIGSVLKIVYEALFWSREKTEGGVLRPLLVVMEEAHRYLGEAGDKAASEIVKRIVKEGRKYGVGAMLISQRPAEVDETVLSQCGTMIALRLTNPTDRARVRGSQPDNLSGLMDLLPVLRTGEAIIAGEAARLPVRCRITLPSYDHQPRSRDPEVTDSWSHRRNSEGYDRMLASWRAQNTIAVAKPFDKNRVPTPGDKFPNGGPDES